MLILKFIQARWFLLSLLTLIVSGLSIGAGGGPDAVTAIKSCIPSKFLTGTTLFLMAFTLDSSQLKAASRTPAPVILACLINAVLMPALGLGLRCLQLAEHFEIGLMIAASVPSTMAAASVITRKAGGNDAISLLTTLVTNSLCFVTTPFWLQMATGQSIQLDSRELSRDLFLLVLVPASLGQLARLIPALKSFAVQHKFALSIGAQCMILVLVFVSALTGGLELQATNLAKEIAGFAVVWSCCIAIHGAGLGAAYGLGTWWRFSPKDRIASAFAASQKTLPVGLYLASNPDAFGEVAFAVFPILMFHASQLFLDTLIAERIGAQQKS